MEGGKEEGEGGRWGAGSAFPNFDPDSTWHQEPGEGRGRARVGKGRDDLFRDLGGLRVTAVLALPRQDSGF